MRRSVVVSAILVVILVAAYLWLFRSLTLGRLPDFTIYFESSNYFMHGVNPYIDRGMFSPYIYPPIVLLLFVPFTIFNELHASIFWTGINLTLLLMSVVILSKIVGISIFSKTGLVLAILSFIAFPIKFSLGMGQINIVILFFMTAGLWMMKGKKEYFSGIFWGLCLVIKLFPVLIPLYLLTKGRIKILAGICITIGVSILLTMVFVPSEIYQTFLRKIIPSFVGNDWKLDYYGQSLGAFIGRSWGIGVGASIAKTAITVMTVGIAFCAVLKNKKSGFISEVLNISFVILTSLIINMYSWQHHYVWVIIPFYVTFAYLRKKKYPAKYFVLLLISYILIAINFVDPSVLPTLLKSHVFFGGIILFAMQAKLLLDRR